MLNTVILGERELRSREGRGPRCWVEPRTTAMSEKFYFAYMLASERNGTWTGSPEHIAFIFSFGTKPTRMSAKPS